MQLVLQKSVEKPVDSVKAGIFVGGGEDSLPLKMITPTR